MDNNLYRRGDSTMSTESKKLTAGSPKDDYIKALGMVVGG